jgi:hypothetical protein
MASGTTLDPGSLGDTITTLDQTQASLALPGKMPVSVLAFGTAANTLGVVNDANPLPIDDAGGSLTVDGTVAVSSVSGDVAITAVSLPLPTGAATAAKQPALGTAGTPSTDVLSVQGRSGMTPIDVGGSLVVTEGLGIAGTPTGGVVTVQGQSGMSPLVVDGSGVTQPVSGTVTANAGTNLNTSALALEAGGNLAAAAASLAILDNAIAGSEMQVDVLTLPAIPAGTNNIGDVDVLTLPAVTNGGTFVVQENGAALTSLQLLDDTIFSDDATFTPGTSKVSMAGFHADETATDSIDEGDAGAARMTLDRKIIVTPQPHASGGLSIHRSIDLDEGALEVVKGSPGCVYGMWVTNQATATRWIKFYDATSGTVGTGTPVITIGIPGNSSDDISGNFGPGGMGIGFATGICVGASTGVADADTGAPGANDLIANIFYK